MQPQSSIAIVICTFNPDKKVFARTLNAVERLEHPEGVTLECVVVDNNSSNPVVELSYVQSFLQRCPWAKVIVEAEQGLTFARIAGVQATSAPILVFIDDDNEPSCNYLNVLQTCLKTYPCVGAWGPGNIQVEFLEPVSDWFYKTFRAKFQERSCQSTMYGCVAARWTDFYPVGTGLIVKREVFDRYHQAIASGTLASTDRKGKSLSSGGDVQIVWEGIKMGLAAGVSPDLQMTHLISGQKSTLNYVKRLTFGATASYASILVESFPSEKSTMVACIPSNGKILKDLASLILRRSIKFKYQLLQVELAKYLGRVVGFLRIVDPLDHHWIYRFVRLLDLE